MRQNAWGSLADSIVGGVNAYINYTDRRQAYDDAQAYRNAMLGMQREQLDLRRKESEAHLPLYQAQADKLRGESALNDWFRGMMSGGGGGTPAPGGLLSPLGISPSGSPSGMKAPAYNGLGSITQGFESGGDPGAVNLKDANGGSFGISQINMPNIPKFLESAPQYKGWVTPEAGPQAVGQQFKSYASNPDFVQAQKNYINQSHYQPAFSEISPLVAGRENDPRIQEAIYSASVQHGPEGARRIFSNVIGNMSPQQRTDIPTEGLLSSIYNARQGVSPSSSGRYAQELPAILGIDQGAQYAQAGNRTATDASGQPGLLTGSSGGINWNSLSPQQRKVIEMGVLTGVGPAEKAAVGLKTLQSLSDYEDPMTKRNAEFAMKQKELNFASDLKAREEANKGIMYEIPQADGSTALAYVQPGNPVPKGARKAGEQDAYTNASGKARAEDEAKNAAQVENAKRMIGEIDNIFNSGAHKLVGPDSLLRKYGSRLMGTRDEAQIAKVEQFFGNEQLAAAQKLKGQGSLTDKERAILEKAATGGISVNSSPETVQEYLSALRNAYAAQAGMAAPAKSAAPAGSIPPPPNGSFIVKPR